MMIFFSLHEFKMIFFLFMAAPVAYEIFQARGQIRAVAEAHTTTTATLDLS